MQPGSFTCTRLFMIFGKERLPGIQVVHYPRKIDTLVPGDNPSRDLNGIVFIRDIQRTERPRSQTRQIYICHIGQRILPSTKYLLE